MLSSAISFGFIAVLVLSIGSCCLGSYTSDFQPTQTTLIDNDQATQQVVIIDGIEEAKVQEDFGVPTVASIV